MRLTKALARMAVDAAGGNLTRAATAIGCERARIAAILGIVETRGAPSTAPDLATVERAIREAGSIRGAASILGCSARTVERVRSATKNDVKTRTYAIAAK